MAKELTAAIFQSAIVDAEKPVLVDFWASWCGPCRALSPIVEEVGEEMADKIDVYKCNVDDESGIAQQFNIMSIPTLVLFKGGQPVHTMVGSTPKAKLIAAINEYV